MRAGILVTGTEVITARIVDRNGPWVSERLGELGVEVAHILCVADRPADLEAGLRFFEQQGIDLVVTSGGLGPTADDLTAALVARFAGVPLVLDEKMEAKIAAVLEGFAKRFRFDADAMREATRKQAMVPEGAIALGPAGTAPGLVVEARGTLVVVLPGPPRELHGMWPEALATDPVRGLLARAEPYDAVTLRLFGIPESEIAKTLRELEAEADLSPLEITTCLRRGELVVDLLSRPGGERLRDRVVERFREAHPRHLFSDGGATIDELLAGALAGHWLGIAESCSGGLLAARLTERPGASAYVAGGAVAYSDAAKSELLGVPPELLREHGAVSPQAASAMAAGAIERFGADLGVGITGIAGPSGGTEEKPVGYVCVCVRDASGAELARDPVIPGDRSEIRDRSATVAMHMLLRLLRGEQAPF